MSTLLEYTVMGEDGKDYGPVDVRQIRQWILEERLEKKSPVKPTGAKDWIFLGTLPEFTKAFDQVSHAPPKLAQRRVAKWLMFFGVVVLAEIIYLLLKQLEILD